MTGALAVGEGGGAVTVGGGATATGCETGGGKETGAAGVTGDVVITGAVELLPDDDDLGADAETGAFGLRITSMTRSGTPSLARRISSGVERSNLVSGAERIWVA